MLPLFNISKSCIKGRYCTLFINLVFTLLSEDLSLQGKTISNFKIFFRSSIMFHIFLMPDFLLVRANEWEMKSFTGMFYSLGRFPCDSQFYFSIGFQRLSRSSLLVRDSRSHPLNSPLKGIKRQLSRAETALNGESGNLMVQEMGNLSLSTYYSIPNHFGPHRPHL